MKKKIFRSEHVSSQICCQKFFPLPKKLHPNIQTDRQTYGHHSDQISRSARETERLKTLHKKVLQCDRCVACPGGDCPAWGTPSCFRGYPCPVWGGTTCPLQEGSSPLLSMGIPSPLTGLGTGPVTGLGNSQRIDMDTKSSRYFNVSVKDRLPGATINILPKSMVENKTRP